MVAVEPPRLSYGAYARLPDTPLAFLAALQASRLVRALPARPAAVALLDALQWPLARALLQRVPGCELWYAAGAGTAHPRFHDEAAHAAALTIAAKDEPLWARLDALGVDLSPRRAGSRSGP